MKPFTYILLNKSNIDAWDENELQDIDLDDVRKITFDTEEDKQNVIDILSTYIIEDYIFITDIEYNLLKVECRDEILKWILNYVKDTHTDKDFEDLKSMSEYELKGIKKEILDSIYG